MIAAGGALVSCAPKILPEYAGIKPVIAIGPEGMSAKWHELARVYIPMQINRDVRANLVSYDETSTARFRMVFRITNLDKEVTGVKSTGIGAVGVTGSQGMGAGIAAGTSKSQIQSTNTIEAEAVLYDLQGKQICKWFGYGENENAVNTMKIIGHKIGQELVKCGVLNPAQYLERTPAPQ